MGARGNLWPGVRAESCGMLVGEQPLDTPFFESFKSNLPERLPSLRLNFFESKSLSQVAAQLQDPTSEVCLDNHVETHN